MINVMKSSLKIVWKTKNKFFIKHLLFFFYKIFYFLRHFFKIPKNLIASAFSFAKADTNKHNYALANVLNAALVKLIDWIIKNGHVINYVIYLKVFSMTKKAMLFDSPQHGF